MEIIKEEGQEKKVYEKKNSKSEEDPPLERFRIVTKQDQKELPKGAFRKRYSENIQQNYKRTPMLKCDFNKFAKEQIYRRMPMPKCDFNKVAKQKIYRRTPMPKCDFNKVAKQI